MNLRVLGGWREVFRLFGTIKPVRLMQKLQTALKAGSAPFEFPSIETLEVVAAEELSPGPVVAMETSTRTYFADGFGAHNSVAQHSINVSLWAEQLAGKDEVERLLCAWDGLFHDASEGLGLKDIPSPVKMLLKPLYAPLEDKLMNALAQQFRFRWPMNGVVKTADMDVFGTEATVMFPIEERPEKWQGTGQQVPGLDVSEWPDWRQTRARWMARYEDLKTRMEKLHG
jgi:hypothetical protein